MNNIPTSSFVRVRIGKSTFAFTGFAAVSAAYTATIDYLDLGASEAPNCELLDAKGNRIGYVSYNGKVWRGDWNANNAVCLFDPATEGAQ